MSKYHFHRLGADRFQEMVQSLLETKRRDLGELTQFASTGADGAREATWRQPTSHPDYVRPANEATDVPQLWVFQVKFHDIGQRGWAAAGTAVIADLKSELQKVTAKYKLVCHHYVLITNVPLTGATRVGTRDRISRVIAEWTQRIPSIEVWDAADLSRMLDNNPAVRVAYLELIVPGDVLGALYAQLHFAADRREGSLRGYLKHLVDNESKARAEEAGDDDPLPLSKVFVDQTLRLKRNEIPESYVQLVETWATEASGPDRAGLLPADLDRVSSGFPLLWGAQDKVMILAGPGYGKSTITQFLALYQAARLIDPTCAALLAKRLKLPRGWSSAELDASCTLRMPFRIELRRYAKWRKTRTGSASVGLAAYIALQLIGGVVESTLDQDDIFAVVSRNPTLLILDGLDEVPNKDDRDALLKDCEAFLYRCSGENVDLQVVMSSRPQGYNGEFGRFQPLEWEINDLGESDFKQYCEAWLSERIRNPEERGEAEERIRRGMASDAVRRLATTLLQATVMLTIVRKKSDIPEERHKLFEKYVEVVFQREKTKSEFIARYERELRLLHEMVGYQIHERVARGEAGVMPGARFKEIVWSVWRLIHGDEQLQQIVPNQEVQRICELSTDRLVFLSGKGTSQSDIDFVIQPYREYFAANYLANDMRADTEQVFRCLVERGAFWQQVLRFYAAIAQPAQQKSWAYGAAMLASDTSGIDELVVGLRARRAVMLALPEFVRFQFEQFKSTVGGCLPPTEWWAWLGQGWLTPIVGTLRQGTAWRELWKAFLGATHHPYGAKAFALWLFPQVIPTSAPEHAALVAFVRETLRDADPDLARAAVEMVLINRPPIGLDEPDEDMLFDVLRYLPYRQRLGTSDSPVALSKRLPPARALRYLCTHHVSARRDGETNAWEFMGLPIEIATRERTEPDETRGPTIMLRQPTWLSISVQQQGRLPLDEGVDCGVYGDYVRLLFTAIQQPDNPELSRKAWAAMGALPSGLTLALQCEYALGPSPDQFDCEDDWLRYKRGIRELFEETEEAMLPQQLVESFGSSREAGTNAWTLLLFPPHQWDCLVSEGLVQAPFVSSARESRWAQIVGLPRDFLEIAVLAHSYLPMPNAHDRIPFLTLMQIAISLHNRGELAESTLARDVLAKADPASIGADDMHGLLRLVRDPSRFPQTWLGPLVEVAVRVDGIDLALVAQFWGNAMGSPARQIWVNIEPDEQWASSEKLVAQLTDVPGDAAVDLAVQISRYGELPPNISAALNRRAVFGVVRGECDPRKLATLVVAMLTSTPTQDEVALYSSLDAFRLLVKSSGPHIVRQLASRIEQVPQNVSVQELPLLRDKLREILDRKENYPPEFSAAALEGLIQLEAITCPPLNEADWQAPSQGGQGS